MPEYSERDKCKAMEGTATGQHYGSFEDAYAYFNQHLFDHALPRCLVTMQRRNSSRAYFAPERFAHRVADAVIAELAFNPDYFLGRADIEILSSLVHEMVHCWQVHYGMPSRPGYHNREWAAKMEALGLMPSDTGKPGGKRTGQRMAHYLIPGGCFAQAAEALLATGFHLHWQSPRLPSAQIDTRQARSRRSKTRFTCPDCGQNAWGAPSAALRCGHCDTAMMPEERDDTT